MYFEKLQNTQIARKKIEGAALIQSVLCTNTKHREI